MLPPKKNFLYAIFFSPPPPPHIHTHTHTPSKLFRFCYLKYCLFTLKYSQRRVQRKDLNRVSKNNIVLIEILSDLNKLQKLQPSPVPELFFRPATYRGWTRAGERRVQNNLHAHAQNEPIKNHQKLVGPNDAARVNVSRNAFFSSRSERKHFLWRW